MSYESSLDAVLTDFESIYESFPDDVLDDLADFVTSSSDEIDYSIGTFSSGENYCLTASSSDDYLIKDTTPDNEPQASSMTLHHLILSEGRLKRLYLIISTVMYRL